MTAFKNMMMSSEALEPAGFISEYVVDSSVYINDHLSLDSNDNIYVHQSNTVSISGTSYSGQIFAKIEGDETNANFGLITNIKMIKMSSTNNASVQGFCISGSNLHGSQLNYVNTSANTRNYATHFKTDLNFSNISTLNSWNTQQLSSWSPANTSIAHMAPDGSGGVYLGVFFTQGNTWDYRGFGVIKVNSSGTYQWKRFLNGTSSSSLRARTLDAFNANTSTGYWAMGGYADGSGQSFNDAGVIGLFNSSGTEQWIKYLSNGNYFRTRGAYVDGSQNVYLCGDNAVQYEGRNVVVTKLNSSGTHQWTKRLNLDSNHNYAHNITVHGDDIYVAVKWTENNPNTYYPDYKSGILKLDTSGNFDYYREITNSSSGDNVVFANQSRDKQLQTDSQGNLIVCFRDSTNGAKNYVMKIPQTRAQSGSFTGTFFNSIQINSVSASFTSITPTIANWHSSTTSPYTLTGSNASLTTVTPNASTNTTSYFY